MLVALGLEESVELFGFAVASFFVQADVKVRASQIAVILRDFVFEDNMVTKCVPGEVGEDAMILMTIIAVMSED